MKNFFVTLGKSFISVVSIPFGIILGLMYGILLLIMSIVEIPVNIVRAILND